MTALEQVNSYLQHLTRRLRLLAISRGALLSAAVALLLTLLLADIGNRYQFAPGVVGPLRAVLYLSVAAALFFVLLIPATKVTQARVTRQVERATPQLEERLLTAAERPDPSNPFTELIAEDALRIARESAPQALEPGPKLWAFAGGAAFVLAALIWLITAGPGPWGYGASLLWTGSAHARQRPLYEVLVQPGNKTIRRKSGQVVQAQLVGFSARHVTVYARYGKGLKWEEAAMQRGASSDRYQFLFPAVTDAIEYYVGADASQSGHFTISVKDLPAVKNVRVTLHFPQALGLQPVSNESGGDVRAVEGSQAEISVLTDKPLSHGVLVLDRGEKVNLTPGEGNWSKATIPVKQDGAYHVAAIDSGETIRISDDYFIEARKDEPPTVRIVKPGHDPRVSPIEEVPVTVEAADDFGVRSLELHYAVNGGSEQVARFKAQNGKEENGHTTLYLENFKLAPGDVVSMYATAADANKTVRSDILFAQAEAFDYKFSQSQQSGNMGGGGAQDNNISERQKQIIAATFNQLRADGNAKSALREQAHFLSDLEGKLGTQAKTLADRMGSRELTQANQEFENFSRLMTQASDDMGVAAQQLSPGKWTDALVPEQKALQSLLRAEAIFRNIQVAFGQQGGAAGSGAQRELARMFDLELDTSKNQYETGQQGGGGAEQQQQALDEAFERLQMLARRQQELAQQRNGQQPAEQRWQEEQLRREAEELKRQLQQLAQNSQNGQQQLQAGSSQGQRSSSAGSSGSQGNSAQNRELSEAMREASNAVSQAEEEMRKAVGTGDQGAQQRAMGQLADAQRRLGNALHRSAGSSLSDLAAQADSLAGQQRDLARRMKNYYNGGESSANRGNEFSGQLGGESGDMPEMNDPDNPRFGYGYRRRNWMQETRPAHRPTEEERSLAEDKEKLGGQVEQLQRGIEQQEQALRGSSPQASRQLQRALSEAEQKELALRMQKNAQWIREGYGDRNLAMEDNVTAGLDQLSKDIRGAQRSLQGGDGSDGQSEKTAQALAQVRQLRQMLERARASQPGSNQPGSNQSGSNQSASNQSGSNPSGSNQSGSPQNGQTGNAGAPGAILGGGNDAQNGELSQRDLDQAIGRLSALRGQISGQDRALGNYLGGTLGHLRDLNADPRVLQATIGQDAVSSLERLEAELTRRLGEQQTQGARSSAAEKPAEQYRDAVADYFKKLSQPPPKN